MPQQFLQGENIAPIAEKLRRESVRECMGMGEMHWQFGGLPTPAKHLCRTGIGERFPAGSCFSDSLGGDVIIPSLHTCDV